MARKDAEPILHRESGERWFQALSPARQEEFHAACRQDAAHGEALIRKARRELRLSAVQIGLIYGLGDVICPGASLGTVLCALLVGALLGAAFQHRHLERLSSGAIGLLAFFLFQIWTRGGVAAATLFWLFPVGIFCAFQSLRREHGD